MPQRGSVGAFPGGDRFEVVRELGRGGMGVVFEVRDRDRRVRLALKGLRRVAPRAILRLKNEFRAVRDSVHPNLVRLDELFEHAGAWFFTMELVDGIDLLRWVRPDDPGVAPTAHEGETSATRADGIAARVVERLTTTIDDAAPPRWTHRTPAAQGPRRFDEARLRVGLRGLVAGIAALHRAGIVHRDVKPSNVLVEPGGRVVLLDFGVVADVSGRADAQDHGREVVGTYAYMAPEQATAEDVGPAADWYALGIVLFEALTGDVPFVGRDALEAKRTVDAPSPRGWSSELPEDLVVLCERLLRRDPSERPDDAELLAFFSLQQDDAGVAFVGRNAELATLRGAFEAVLAGRRARAVFVTGESGIGKSALARRFLDEMHVAHPDLLVLPARCDQRELVSYNAFDGAVDALSRHLAALPAEALEAPGGTRPLLRTFPVLRDVAALEAAARRAPTAATVDQRALAFAALADLLAAVASRRPTVVLIDDVHWADADSLALLGEVFSGADAPPLLVLATARLVGDAAIAARAAIRVPADVVKLGGLDVAEAEALVRAEAPGADAARLASETGGHPMFLAELAHRVGQGGEPALRLDDALWQRVIALDEGPRALLEVVALGAGPLPLGAVPAAAGLGPEGFARAFGALRAARLIRVTGSRDVDTIEPYHDRVRETVAANLDAERRRAVHRAIVTSLEGGSAGVEMLAYHLAQAGDGARAGVLAETAARRALESLAFDRAAEWLRLTLEVGELTPERRRELVIEHADLLSRAGRTAEAGEAFLAASEGEPPDRSRELRRRAAEELLNGGHFERGKAIARQLADEIGVGVPQTTAGAIAALLWYQARLRLSSLHWIPRDPASVSTRDQLRMDVAWSVATGFSMIDSTRGAVLAMRSPLLAMPTGDPVRMARALCAATTAASGMGNRRLATRLRDAVHRVAVDAEPIASLYAAFSDVAYCFYLTNEWHASALACERAAAFVPDRRGHTFEADVIEQHHVWNLFLLGEYRQLRRRVPPAIRSAQRIGNRFIEISFRTWFAIIPLMDDRAAEALADVRDAMAAWQTQGDQVTNPFFFGLKSRSQIALYNRDLDADADLDADWARVRASLLYRIPLIRVEVTQFMGMFAVARAVADPDGPARARHLADARRWSRRTRAVDVPAAAQIAGLLDIGIAAAAGDLESAAACLPPWIDHLDATHQRAVAAAARWRLGQTLGASAGANHLATAAAYFAAEGIARPERIVDMLLPGW